MSERCLIHGRELRYDMRSGFEICDECERDKGTRICVPHDDYPISLEQLNAARAADTGRKNLELLRKVWNEYGKRRDLSATLLMEIETALADQPDGNCEHGKAFGIRCDICKGFRSPK